MSDKGISEKAPSNQPFFDFAGASNSREFVVAVTGHRDIDQHSKVIDCLKILFERINQRHPERIIVLISALAEGADRLAFRALKEWSLTSDGKNKSELRIVLPMPEEIYRKTFDADGKKEKQEEFDTICGDALNKTSKTILNKDNLADLMHAGVTDAQKHIILQECYASLSDYYRKNADALIALWDGVYNGKKGGTANVLQTIKESEAADSRCKKIWWLATPRVSNPHTTKQRFTWTDIPVIGGQKNDLLKR